MKGMVVGVLAVAGALLALELVAGPWVSFAVRQSPPVRHGQRLVGSLEGPVKSTDEQAGIVRVAAGFLGMSSLPIIVTGETTIAVDGKLGWLGDLRRGLMVRVAYEVLPDDRLVASRVELIDRAPPPSAGVATDRSEPDARHPRSLAAPPGVTPAPAAADSAAASTAPDATSPPEAAAARRAQPEASTARSAAPGPAALSPASPPRRASRQRPPSISARASVSSPPAESAAPSHAIPAAEGTPSEDGRAAIDWLFREAPLGR